MMTPADVGRSEELSPEALRLVASYGHERTFARSTIVVSEDDHSNMFYLLLSGRVKVFVSDEKGKEVLLNTQGPGSYFGEIAIIDKAPRSASVITLEPCRMAVVSRQEFMRCLGENPEVAMAMIHHLVARVRALTSQVKGLALQNVYARVTQTLSRLAREENGVRIIPQRLTHQEIADQVGASREMVSRILKDLTAGGYVRIENRKIVLCKTLPVHW